MLGNYKLTLELLKSHQPNIAQLPRQLGAYTLSVVMATSYRMQLLPSGALAQCERMWRQTSTSANFLTLP